MCTDAIQNRKGFTMIEAVIAFGVLTIAILGPVTLVAFSLARSQASQNKMVAVQLAQEGLELVRAIRDNNAICDNLSSHPPPVAVRWNANPAGGPRLGEGSNNLFTVDAHAATLVNNGAACGATPAFSAPLPAADPACSAKTLHLDANGNYTYGPGTPTPFQRCVTICVPATSAPCNGAVDSDVHNASDQMEVISKVFWLDRGLQHSVQFRERLYNWK